MLKKMHQERENLDIIFRRRTPESLLDDIRVYYRTNQEEKRQPALPYEIDSFEKYDYFGVFNLPGYSGDEIRMRYKYLKKQCMESDHSIFGLLYEYADKVLIRKNQTPVCRMKEILNWNSITLRLGQDLFVTSWMAWNDVKNGKSGPGFSYTFNWPSCLHTDDLQLNKLMESGLAENHFHLGGSTQVFPLSWAAMMNHPSLIYSSVCSNGRFSRNLVIDRSAYSKENEMRWIKLLRYAALIRVLLFTICISKQKNHEKILNDFFLYDLKMDNASIEKRVESVRLRYGTRVRIKDFCSKCLDYAMSDELYKVDTSDYHRLLTSERALLYHCFSNIYQNEMNSFEKSLFYFYLLIKSNFRSELIQTNFRCGFYNFSQYQDRKYQFYSLREYEIEAQRLAVCANIKDNCLKSLEARIMPGRSAKQMAGNLYYYDKLVGLSSVDDLQTMFYVVHFPKSSIENQINESDVSVIPRPRNWKTRNCVYGQAKAIYNFRQYCWNVKNIANQNLQFRLKGIDACSSEIGCRPENFATEFRFLRSSEVGNYNNNFLFQEIPKRQLGITYHVGEDFLDICDGLRAVDEAIQFLGLKSGDRIGHGLVLGLDPELYYQNRYKKIYISKQDYLDNCIWLLFRTLEWGITLTSAEREFLKSEARRISSEIYGTIEVGQNTDIYDTLYHSWQLRGDHPSLYMTGEYQRKQHFSIYSYDDYMVGDRQFDCYRDDKCIANLYYRYHFDEKVKRKGLEVIAVDIEDWYVKLMGKLQEYMCHNRIADNRIAIECNPTSNKLIGYFNAYDEHPILKFNDNILNPVSVHPQILVSVNTDDLGVFDTSLSYEYALIFRAIQRKRHSQGDFNDQKIYDYLAHIISNGFVMRFDTDY